MVEVDIKYGVHFGFNRWWYQYTAIDLASKWRLLRGYENRQNSISLQFLKELAKKTRFMFKLKTIKTDNDPVFTNRITGYLKSTDPLNPRLHPFDIPKMAVWKEATGLTKTTSTSILDSLKRLKNITTN